MLILLLKLKSAFLSRLLISRLKKMMLLRRSGLCFAIATLLLQISVYLQPLLPEEFQIAPVCLSITHNLLTPEKHKHVHETYHDLVHHLTHDHEHDHDDHNSHNHQCQYCTVYGDLVLPFDLGIDEIIDKIHVHLSLYKNVFRHVYFSLQRLYLLPQGRAPPYSL